jgi:3-deoxy-D-manno-octulosonate 8-phosphate phosphatase KdsC-like HAD superfamily phosphatase
VTDCDGIFTSANIQCDAEGKRGKLFSVNDSLTVDFILEKYGDKIDIVVLTGDSGQGLEVTKKRLDYMGLKFVHCKNVFKYAYIKKNYPDPTNVCYIGDDIYDFLIMKEIPGATVCNAPAIVKKYAGYVSPYEGGKNGLTDILFAILTDLGIDYEADLTTYILEKQKEYDVSN